MAIRRCAKKSEIKIVQINGKTTEIIEIDEKFQKKKFKTVKLNDKIKKIY